LIEELWCCCELSSKESIRFAEIAMIGKLLNINHKLNPPIKTVCWIEVLSFDSKVNKKQLAKIDS